MEIIAFLLGLQYKWFARHILLQNVAYGCRILFEIRKVFRGIITFMMNVCHHCGQERFRFMVVSDIPEMFHGSWNTAQNLGLGSNSI